MLYTTFIQVSGATVGPLAMLHTRDISVEPGQLFAVEKQTKTIVRGVYQNPDNNLCPQIVWKFPSSTLAWYSQLSPRCVCFPRTEEWSCALPGSSMPMPGSTEACKGSIHVLSSAKAWLVLLTGLLSLAECSDMLKRCELHQDLSALLVPVLPVAVPSGGADVRARRTPVCIQRRCGKVCPRADAICIGCQPWG